VCHKGAASLGFACRVDGTALLAIISYSTGERPQRDAVNCSKVVSAMVRVPRNPHHGTQVHSKAGQNRALFLDC